MAEPARAPARPARRPRRRPDAVDLSGIAPVPPVRRADRLAEQIRRFIVSADIAEGARLPAERDLAERFGASRPTVSQALRSLSLMGLVEIRHGSGAYVVRRPETMVAASVSLMLDLDQKSVGHLMRLRLWLETLGVDEAIARAPALSEAQAGEVEAALRRLGETAGRTSEWIAADTVFHAAIVRAAGNPYLTAMYESVHGAVLSYELREWVDAESEPRWLRESGPEQHWALHEPIAAAVLKRDATAARAAVLAHHKVMTEHLESSAGPAGPAR